MEWAARRLIAAFGLMAWDQAFERHWGAAAGPSSVVAPS
jgi:hypothetical protein